MSRYKPFQIVLFGTFALLLFAGFLGFSGLIPLPNSNKAINYGTVTLWGTIPSQVMQEILTEKLSANQQINIQYIEKNKATFSKDFIEALARGDGPDLFMLSQDEILQNLDKIALMPYQSLTERDFKNTFIQEGEMFLRPEGVAGIPLTIDPLVMYWNRDIFTSTSIATPPLKWSEFYGLAPRIVVRNQVGDITQGLAPLGEFRNVTHAKELLSAIMMQAGSAIVGNQNGALAADLGAGAGNDNPAVRAFNFYTEFSRSDKDSYSWSRSLPSSFDMFVSGNLALYFGYASEYQSIKARNPHLNFDVAPMPQPDKTLNRSTFGQMQGVAMVKASKNLPGAMYAEILLSDSGIIGSLAQKLGLPPVRRDLLSTPSSTNASSPIFYDAALISKAWLDPSPSDTNQLFQTAIDDINSGRYKTSEALDIMQGRINKLLSNT